MTPSRTVGVVFVNWNSSGDVLRAISAVRSEYPEVSVVVVDNASAEDDWATLRTALPRDVILHRLEENAGYAAGVNQALRQVQSQGLPWAWLMNPDALPYPDCLNELLARSEGCGLVGPRQLSSETPLDDEAVPYTTAAYMRDGKVSHEACQGCDKGFHDVDVVTGTGLLVDVNRAHDVGLMNESFFHYKEEFEFAERVHEVSLVRYACAARLWHHRGGSMAQGSPTASYYRVRNELLYLAMRYGRHWRWQPRVWRWVARSAAGAIRVPAESRRATRRGISDGLRGRSGRLT